MPKQPLTCLRFKLAKSNVTSLPPAKIPQKTDQVVFGSATIFLPVDSKSTLSTLRTTLLSALKFAASDTSSPEFEYVDLTLPGSEQDIALWRLEPATNEEDEENWIRLTDEKSTADKLGLREAEQVAVSFKNAQGEFPKPLVIRPREDEYEEGPLE
ncbi:uncharacterized protein JCM15063_005789 [Sporobolomyces koalae]|uniref:uncharacterized protein n=1 Tax=Sporobolomyces koalae TaxID=500713 RepID=UPI00317CEEE6